ncbi:MAG: type II toxin-antitoxin system VapC family toxin [Candidatus Lokiarchaeota archaeon]|nr:type II toxin-antitoxin system VapC family toxin [Candidatus Lokiarchaeota archaeon]
MRYIDASVFVHAYWKPRDASTMPAKTKWIKEAAKRVIVELNDEEEERTYCMSIFQLAEVCNILKIGMSWAALQEFSWGLLSNPAILVVEVPISLYMNAVDKIASKQMDPNDIVALAIMENLGIDEIYTFDKHIRQQEKITCLPPYPGGF